MTVTNIAIQRLPKFLRDKVQTTGKPTNIVVIVGADTRDIKEFQRNNPDHSAAMMSNVRRSVLGVMKQQAEDKGYTYLFIDKIIEAGEGSWNYKAFNR